MGWLVDRAKERQRNLASAGTIASMAWKAAPKGVLGSQEALANRLRRLDAGEGVDWWGSAEGRTYMEAVAGVLKLQPTEFTTWLETAIPTPDDDARWFHFELFPALRPLDLDTEDPFPGVPRELFAGEGPTQLTWWHAPAGAGRTLLSKWLVRRHGWTIASTGRCTERSFLEQRTATVPEVGRARRVIVAAPHPMPEECRTAGWTEVVTPKRWELALVRWVGDRLNTSGAYNRDAVEAYVREGQVPATTPGQLLEILADVDTLGEAALSDTVPHDRRLEAWVRAHARRADRTARAASRAYLGDHGAHLIRETEITRRIRGLAISRATVIACLPEPQHASADAIRAAYDAGDVARALQLIHPQREDLADTMLELRWIIPEGWGFPTRVLGWLHMCVAEALAQGDDLARLGAVVDTPDMALPVLKLLATPAPLAAWIKRLEGVTALEPETALGIDAIVLATTLSEALGHVVNQELRSLLRASILRLAGEEGVAVGLSVDERWSALAWVMLFPPTQTPTDLQRQRLETAGRLLHDADDEPEVLGPLRLLAAAWFGDIAAKDRASGGGDILSHEATDRLQTIRRLDVTERFCRRWASTLEAVASLLWPIWEQVGVPEETDLVRLGRVWATYPSEPLSQALRPQILDHICRGVELPERLWQAAMDVHGGDPDVMERAPVDILFAMTGRFPNEIPAVLWRRVPGDAIARVAELLEARADAAPWLRVAPLECSVEILAMLSAIETPPADSIVWSDRVIAGRAPGWKEVWMWRMR